MKRKGEKEKRRKGEKVNTHIDGVERGGGGGILRESSKGLGRRELGFKFHTQIYISKWDKMKKRGFRKGLKGAGE